MQAYLQRRNQHLAAAIADGDHEPEVDPYAFVDGDVKFTFSDKKDKAGGEKEQGKKHKVGVSHTGAAPANFKSRKLSKGLNWSFNIKVAQLGCLRRLLSSVEFVSPKLVRKQTLGLSVLRSKVLAPLSLTPIFS